MNFSQSFLLDHVTDCLCLMQTSVNKQSGGQCYNCENLPQSPREQLNTILFNDFFHIRKIQCPLSPLWSSPGASNLDTAMHPWPIHRLEYLPATSTDVNTSHNENGTLFSNITLSSFPVTVLTLAICIYTLNFSSAMALFAFQCWIIKVGRALQDIV